MPPTNQEFHLIIIFLGLVAFVPIGSNGDEMYVLLPNASVAKDKSEDDKHTTFAIFLGKADGGTDIHEICTSGVAFPCPACPYNSTDKTDSLNDDWPAFDAIVKGLKKAEIPIKGWLFKGHDMKIDGMNSNKLKIVGKSSSVVKQFPEENNVFYFNWLVSMREMEESAASIDKELLQPVTEDNREHFKKINGRLKLTDGCISTLAHQSIVGGHIPKYYFSKKPNTTSSARSIANSLILVSKLKADSIPLEFTSFSDATSKKITLKPVVLEGTPLVVIVIATWPFNAKPTLALDIGHHYRQYFKLSHNPTKGNIPIRKYHEYLQKKEYDKITEQGIRCLEEDAPKKGRLSLYSLMSNLNYFIDQEAAIKKWRVQIQKFAPPMEFNRPVCAGVIFDNYIEPQNIEK